MPLRVLVVEDEPTIRHVITETLLDEGYDVLTAPDGLVALERVQEHPPDVIVLDYQLPHLDGPGFAHAYRQLPEPHAPIILMTAALRAEERGTEVGAQACLGKPFELDALVSLVGQATASREVS